MGKEPIYANGTRYESVPAAVEALGLSRTIIYRNIAENRMGWYRESTGQLPNPLPAPGLRGGNRKEIVIDGVTYPSLAEAARATGTPISTLTRQFKAPKEEKQAADAAPRREHAGHPGKPVTVKGATYPSRLAACEALELSPTGLAGLMKREALGIEKRKTGPAGNPIRVNGVEYPNQAAAARALGVDQAVISRLAKMARSKAA